MPAPLPPLAPLWPGHRIALGGLVRGGLLWLVVRLAVGTMPGLVLPSLIVVATVAGAALVDLRRRRLAVFLANLGVPSSTVVLYWLLPAALLELTLLVVGVGERTGLLMLMS